MQVAAPAVVAPGGGRAALPWVGVVDVVVVDQHHRGDLRQVAESPQPQVPAVEHVQDGFGAPLAGGGPMLVVLVAHGGQQLRLVPAQRRPARRREVEVAPGVQPQRVRPGEAVVGVAAHVQRPVAVDGAVEQPDPQLAVARRVGGHGALERLLLGAAGPPQDPVVAGGGAGSSR